MKRFGRLSTIWLTWAAAAFLLPHTAASQEAQVSASVTTGSVGVNEQFQLTVRVSGKDIGEVESPRLPRLDGLEVVGGPSVSTQFEWVNGRSSSSKTYTYVLIPEKEGQHTIGPIEVRAAGQTFRTQPIFVRVTAGSGAAPRARRRAFDPFEEDSPARAPGSGGDVIVIAEFDRTSAYVGQQVTLTYHLLTEVGVSGLQLQESPPLTGFWVEDLEVERSPAAARRSLNGRSYLDYAVKKQALFPNAPGRIPVPPSTFAISARTAGDFFGIFGQTETLYRKTREIYLDVKPLPSTNQPERFSGAVGSFNLTSSFDKGEATVGEAVSLRIKLSGRGNLKMIPDLVLPAAPDISVYSSKRSDNIRTLEAGVIGGEKVWEYVLVPKAPGNQAIPPVEFSYFDPESEAYRTVATPGLELQVIPGTDSGNPITSLSGVNKQSITRQGNDINYIKVGRPDLRPEAAPIYQSVWFYVMAALPLAFNAGAIVYKRQRTRLHGNAGLMKSRRARKVAVAKLQRAAKAGHGSSRGFYDQAAAALAGYLSDRFGLSAIEVSSDTLERSLTDRAVPPETIRETIACIQECDFGRFVPASAVDGKPRALAQRIRKLFDALERVE